MKYIDSIYTNEIVILKSRFITSIYKVESIDEVNDILNKTRKKYYDASHNCYGYILGDRAEIQKCSDDGEPQKTAGFPILDVLKKNEVTNILCIVTRYFGGTLLGAGGLVRAYSESCSECLKKAKILIKKELNTLIVKLDYSSYNTLISSLKDIIILDTSYASDISIKLAVDNNRLDSTIQSITNITKGNALIEDSGLYETFIPID
jgi:uncharacterized YigZ family protein